MFKFIVVIIFSVIVTACGVTAYYLTSSQREVSKFSKNLEKVLNQNIKKAEKVIDADTRVRNMLKFRVKPYKCSVKDSIVTCVSERLYIGGPFMSYDAKENIVKLSFKDNNTVSSSIKLNGVFESEESRYTKSFKMETGLECDLDSLYIAKDGIFENSNTCKSSFGTLNFDSVLEYSVKDKDLINKKIYDAVLEYYKSADIDNEDDYEIAFNALSFNINSSNGVFNDAYDYISDILAKNLLSRAEVHEFYKALREELYNELINEEADDYQYEYILQLFKQALKASDGIIMDNHKTLSLEIFTENKNKFFSSSDIYDMDILDSLIENYTFKIESIP